MPQQIDLFGKEIKPQERKPSPKDDEIIKTYNPDNWPRCLECKEKIDNSQKVCEKCGRNLNPPGSRFYR